MKRLKGLSRHFPSRYSSTVEGQWAYKKSLIPDSKLTTIIAHKNAIKLFHVRKLVFINLDKRRKFRAITAEKKNFATHFRYQSPTFFPRRNVYSSFKRNAFGLLLHLADFEREKLDFCATVLNGTDRYNLSYNLLR